MTDRIWPTLLLTASLVLPTAPAPSPPYQDNDNNAAIEAILDEMSPEDRVGQLFLVTYYGTDIAPESDIARLIQGYRIGGVVLHSSHDNFLAGNDVDFPSQVQALTTSLQTLASEGVSTTGEESPYVPLFIGVEHEGDSWPHTEALVGMTPLPSQMALGATWDPAYAETAGQIVGAELSALGFNLVLGPSADVLGTPQPFTPGDLGTRTFGGEPFWVSQMTAAYVRGMHIGSDEGIIVVPRHFPGYGGADRPATIEVPTVRRSLDQLTQVDLAPFYAVTGYATDTLDQADGLMTGHIRYLGFQGENPRLPTRPISLDAQALGVLMTLDPIATWRDDGGLIMSDALGLRGIRRFYDPTGTTFRNRRIAQDAFLAGNDILYLNEFGQEPELDQTDTIIDTIEFFVQTYNSDPAFQARVDDAVRRILAAKLTLYSRFELSRVTPSAGSLEQVGEGREVAFGAAESAATLLSPTQIEQGTPPELGERILIFTDTRTIQQCSTCPATPLIAVDALETAIFRLYGPQGSRAVNTFDVESYSFSQLATFLSTGVSGIEEPVEGEEAPAETDVEEPTPQADPLETRLNTADWIVFVMLDVTTNEPDSSTVQRFLAERPDIAARARVVVMAMGAPYYLDSTDVSKLDAYYALYGATEPFVDVAARVLFQGSPPHGASPVSVPAIDYDIIEATSPDSSQVISLFIESETPEEGEPETTPVEPSLEQGDALGIRTGVIVDYNGNPVPDGTPVEFVLDYVNQGARNTERVTTIGGVARIGLLLDSGELHISASSEPAMLSDTIQIVIPETGGATISRGRPNPPPTPTPTTSPEPPTPDYPPDTPTPTTTPVSADGEPRRHVDFGDLFLTMVGLLALGSGAFWYENVWKRKGLNVGLLMALPPIVGGLLTYNYYAMALPGARLWRDIFSETWGAATAAWMGGLIGLGIAILVLYRERLWHYFNRR